MSANPAVWVTRKRSHCDPAGWVRASGKVKCRFSAQVVVAARDATSTQCLAVVELRYCSDLLGSRPGGSGFVPADLPYAIPSPPADEEE